MNPKNTRKQKCQIQSMYTKSVERNKAVRAKSEEELGTEREGGTQEVNHKGLDQTGRRHKPLSTFWLGDFCPPKYPLESEEGNIKHIKCEE